ncbi:hypothetical protein NQ317_018461 [Molorchus minor]|uniref:Uncharacterized protein n=1 Tax=Molorchus minor TaxID=1323400 RepID=A0ABQ9JGJ8_9CUCU|nr:hypothetical protein NQ317_018461 [Molorchus minor]
MVRQQTRRTHMYSNSPEDSEISAISGGAHNKYFKLISVDRQSVNILFLTPSFLTTSVRPLDYFRLTFRESSTFSTEFLSSSCISGFNEQVAIRKIWDSKVVKLVWTDGCRALILRRNKVIEDAWLTGSFQRASVCIVGDFQLKIPFCWSSLLDGRGIGFSFLGGVGSDANPRPSNTD